MWLAACHYRVDIDVRMNFFIEWREKVSFNVLGGRFTQDVMCTCKNRSRPTCIVMSDLGMVSPMLPAEPAL